MNQTNSTQVGLSSEAGRLREQIKQLQQKLNQLTGESADLAASISAHPYADLVEKHPDLLLVEQHGRVVYMNPAGAKALRADAPIHLVGRDPLEFFADCCRDVVAARGREAGNTGVTTRLTNAHICRQDGTCFPAELTLTPIMWQGAPALHVIGRSASESIQASRAFAQLVEITATNHGEAFFSELAKQLAKTINTRHVIVGRLEGDTGSQLHLCGAWSDGATVDIEKYDTMSTPCELVVQRGSYFCRSRVQQLFPDDQYLMNMEAESYLGMALCDSQERVIGVLCAVDDKPLDSVDWVRSIVNVFAARAASELERQESESALLASQNRFRSIFEHSNDAILLIEPMSGEIVDANSRSESLLGYPRDTICSMKVSEFHRGDVAHFQQFCERVFQCGEGWGDEFSWQTSQGKNIACEISASRIDLGERRLLLAHVRDVTERRQLESLHLSQNLILEEIARGTPLKQVLDDLCHRVEQFVPGAVCSILLVEGESGCLRFGAGPGLSDELAQAIDGLVPGERSGSCGAAALTGKTVIVTDTRVDPRWADLQQLADRFDIRACWSVPLYAGDHVIGTFAISHTEAKSPRELDEQLLYFASRTAEIALDRHASDQKLRDREGKLHSVLTTATDYIISLDLRGNIVYVNRVAEGQTEADVIGHSAFKFTPPEWHQELKEAMQIAYDTREARSYEAQGLNPDGSVNWYSCRVGPVLDDGHVIGYTLCATDISNRKRSEESLRQREDELAHVSRLAMMGEMVAELAHEINQPLYAISNYARATAWRLAELELNHDDDLVDWCNRIERAATGAGEITKRLRGFVKQSKDGFGEFYLCELISESIALLNWNTRSNRGEIRFNPPQTPVTVYADRIQIQQVLVNLLKNASEASQTNAPGNRRVDVKLYRDLSKVRVAITDNGPGLDVHDAEQLFRPFVSTKPDGMGMGLAVSRSIIERHNGQLWFENSSPVGVTVCFNCSLAAADEALEAPDEQAA